MATITDPTLTAGVDATGHTVYVGDPSLNPQFSYPGTTPNTPAPSGVYQNPNSQTPSTFGTPTSSTPKPYTAFSSDTASNTYIPDNTQKMQTLKNTGLTVGQDGLARYSDQSFATAPTTATQNEDGTWQSGGVRYAIGPATSADPELTRMNDQINEMKAQFDSTSKAAIDNIQKQFESLITQQKDINTRSQASLDQTLLMGGSSRYAQISSSGQMTAIMSYGLQQIADLNTKEQSAVIQAQQAMDAGDMKLMDSSLALAQKARDDKQAAAQTLSDRLMKQNDALKVQQAQATKDKNVMDAITASGTTDPSQILKTLQQSGHMDITAKDITDALTNLNPDAKEIMSVLGDVSKMNAPQDVRTAIANSKTLADAYKAAGRYLTDPTTNAAMYNSYVQRIMASGGTPVSAEKFLATQDYNKAYNTKAASNAADAAYASSGKGQNTLEQQYRQVLLKEVSNRSGGLGLQDQKVNQAIHLKTLINQYKDANGNYNIPTAQYYELVFGLANLVSPNGTTAESDRRELASKTAAGDLRGALQYVTGVPQNGNTQAIIKNLVDSIDRQGAVSEDLRNQGVQFLHGLAPTELDQSRIDALEKNTLASYRNPPQDPLVKATAEESAAANDIKAFDAQSSENSTLVDQLKAKFPTASATEIKAALGI